VAVAEGRLGVAGSRRRAAPLLPCLKEGFTVLVPGPRSGLVSKTENAALAGTAEARPVAEKTHDVRELSDEACGRPPVRSDRAGRMSATHQTNALRALVFARASRTGRDA
jgi:hypothetical protein